MPITERDIRRSASLLLIQYGERAAIEMKRRTRALAELGDLEGADLWRRIVDAISAMRDRRDVMAFKSVPPQGASAAE